MIQSDQTQKARHWTRGERRGRAARGRGDPRAAEATSADAGRARDMADGRASPAGPAPPRSARAPRCADRCDSSESSDRWGAAPGPHRALRPAPHRAPPRRGYRPAAPPPESHAPTPTPPRQSASFRQLLPRSRVRSSSAMCRSVKFGAFFRVCHFCAETLPRCCLSCLCLTNCTIIVCLICFQFLFTFTYLFNVLFFFLSISFWINETLVLVLKCNFIL